MQFILFYTCVLIRMCTCLKAAQEESFNVVASTEETLTLDLILRKFHKMEEMHSREIQRITLEQTSRIDALQRKQLRQEREAITQRRKLKEQENRIQNQQNMITRLQKLETKNTPKQEAKLITHHEPGLHLQTGYACDTDSVTLSCTYNKTITVTSAYYGQYVQTCSDACCPPHPQDCVESLEEHSFQDWMALKAVCDNQTSCEFQNPGRNVPSCADPYISDYIIIYYSCIPEDTSQPVAFSAYASATRVYNDGDIIMFEFTETNIGNHYQTTTSTFLCPLSGLYVFHTSMLSDNIRFLRAHIMRETQMIATAYGVDAHFHQGSNLAITECYSGERVWVKAYADDIGVHASGGTRFSTFSGFLLHMY